MAVQQRCAIEFCVLLGKKWIRNAETHPSNLWRRCSETSCDFQSDQEGKTACSTILLKLAANGLQHVFEKWVERCKK
jgi:hypothetical protein